MRRYNLVTLAREALRGHSGWEPAWRKATPRERYDVVIVGGGGHGLATAYYLARTHGVKNVCVIERGWLGGGNTGRNTTIVRSNYLAPESMAIYGLAHRLYETLSQELDFNVMFSARGVLNLAQTRHEVETLTRISGANTNFGIDSWMLPPHEVKRMVPAIEVGADRRFPLMGALWQPKGGVARHDAVAWGYARAASELGVDIVEDCAVERVIVEGGRAVGVETARGRILADRVAVAAAAATPAIVATAGVRLPIRATTLQAFVSEPLKPVLDVVVMAGATHGYISQSDKGELVIGGAAEAALDHTRCGSSAVIERTVASILELFPSFSRVRLMRQWGGTVDMTPDRSPIIGPVGPEGLWVNCGWGTGGFKAIPGSGTAFAASLAAGRPDDITAPFALDRFRAGRVIDEGAAAAVAH